MRRSQGFQRAVAGGGGDDIHLGIVIVSWNVRDHLRRCLDSLRSANVGCRLVVVDNASADGTVDMVRREHPSALLLTNRANLGYSAANNQGLRALGLGGDAQTAPPYVLLLNPDTEVVGGALDIMIDAMASRPDVGAIGPRLEYPDGSYQSSCRRFPSVFTGVFESTPVAWHWPGNPVARRYHLADREPISAGEVDWITGAALLLRRDALMEVGVLDERFFMYSEELDLCRRLRAAGWRIRYEPTAMIVHHEAASSDQAGALRHRYFQQSRTRYFRKHHGRAAALAVRTGVQIVFGAELLLEAAKWLIGHRRPLRRARVAAYRGLIAALAAESL